MTAKILGIDRDEGLVKRVSVSEGGWVGGRRVSGAFSGLDGTWTMSSEPEDRGGETCSPLPEDRPEISSHA